LSINIQTNLTSCRFQNDNRIGSALRNRVVQGQRGGKGMRALSNIIKEQTKNNTNSPLARLELSIAAAIA